MLLSVGAQYAISGVLRLAALPEGGFCRLDDLIVGTNAPRAAVAKIFQELSKRGILDSTRGTGGGFRLAPGARKFTLMDVVEAVDGPWQSAVLSERGMCLPDQVCALASILQPISDQLETLLRKSTVEALLRRFPQDAVKCCDAACSCSQKAMSRRRLPR